LGNSIITESNGNIGIGATSPTAPLHIEGAADLQLRIVDRKTSGRNWAFSTGHNKFGDFVFLDVTGNANVWRVLPGNKGAFLIENRNVGIGTNATAWNQQSVWGKADISSNHGIGTRVPTAPLHIETGADLQVRIVDKTASGRSWAIGTSHNNPGDFVLLDVTGNVNVWRVLPSFTDNNGLFVNGAFAIENRNVGIGTNTPQAKLDVSGMTRTVALQITGGADLAEPFEVSGAEAVKPGLVVAIDPRQPGRLRLADKAYDRTVAGVVSGANGINPGLTMKQQGTLADGSLPVSLTGRVYCWVDASYGSIKPGDLLTTSKTPGHAMKVTKHLKAGGAIIGKAMTGLKAGKGLVLVLVTLQ
jgi:hypothetical protein